MDRSDQIIQFIDVTGCDPDIANEYLQVSAKSTPVSVPACELPTAFLLFVVVPLCALSDFLQACGWDVDAAVAMFLEGQPPSTTSARASAAGGRGSHGGADGGFDDEGVRAASDARVERLVDTGMGGYGGPGHGLASDRMVMPQVNSAFRNFEAERVHRGGGKPGATATAAGTRGRGTKDLSAIFRPPTHMIFPGGWEALRAAGKAAGRWLLVNIQDDEEFDSWRLNRDTWSNETLQQVISSSYLFWQQQRTLEVASGGAGAGTRASGPGSKAATTINEVAAGFISRYHLETDGGFFPRIVIIGEC